MSAEKIHFVGVGGVGTGSLAQALALSGYEVSGSDKVLYEPMKSVLAHAQVKFLAGYESAHLNAIKPDKVIIGNVIAKENPEARAWIQSGIPFLSFPEAVRTYLIGDKHSVVIAGTHGKTTTTSWVAYLYEQVGLDPSYLIGGVPHDLDRGSKLTQGGVFVGEGDEYDSAFFDKGAKFLHYNPRFLILTGVEFDHADIYKDLEDIKRAFRKLIALLPGDGLCIARYEDPVTRELIQESLCPVETFGTTAGAMWQITSQEETPEGARFEVAFKGRSVGKFESPLFGEYNYLNLLSGIISAVNLGVPIEKIRPVVSRFRGVKRRQDYLLRKPVTIIDDFAHHPTAVVETLKAVRTRHSTGKVWALFEPRSATSRSNTHQNDYVDAFDSADHILIKTPFNAAALAEEKRLSVSAVVSGIQKKGKDAKSFEATDELLSYLLALVQPGDTVVVMSNGEFDKIQEKLAKALG